jgi:hypothetical protein
LVPFSPPKNLLARARFAYHFLRRAWVSARFAAALAFVGAAGARFMEHT